MHPAQDYRQLLVHWWFKMRFLKTLTLNRRAIYDSRVALTTANNFTLADSLSMILPKSNSVISNPTVGQMRYNTTTNDVEVYQGTGGAATWRALRFRESGAITQQAIGTGDGTNTVFGPLSPQPPTIVANGATWGARNLLVIVGNVIQIATTNYVVLDGASITIGPSALGPYTTGQKYIQFTSSVPGLSTPVVVLHGFDQ